MGQDIDSSRFQHQDFHRFERKLVSEMALLHEYFRMERFSQAPLRIGLELEAWLVDEEGFPQMRNTEFLERVDSPLIVPELSQFNIEFNVEHQALKGLGLHHLNQELSEHWKHAEQVASEMDLQVAMIGVLPTIENRQLTLKTMSPRSRFRALNEQILRLRRERPLRLKLEGDEELDIEHRDVMLEAAATSLQVHFQVPLRESVSYFNAAMMASAPVLAISANSPYLFGKTLWQESRIPLFEQAVDIGGPFPRVHFGTGYAMESLEELFLENRICHPVLLPVAVEEPAEVLPHVRLHNGTIWRWNRPLIGFDSAGEPHLRIEHRVMAAGPTLKDIAANIAFATGLIHSLAQMPGHAEKRFPFELAQSNFVAAAQKGLQAEIIGFDGKRAPIKDYLLEVLIPVAEEGLQSLKIASRDINESLEVIARRVESGQNGAQWQRDFIQRHGRDFALLTREYLKRQQAGHPVHEWQL